ncbi:tyrosine-type recombinase/integrase [Herpetosiphon sp. NSE202]|uniref:tyrosine-type recombinase/integrase n=1 Tax=Herpetosiphon sp. NSE202 TaxID=3351349 RepID=UPI003626ED5B
MDEFELIPQQGNNPLAPNFTNVMKQRSVVADQISAQHSFIEYRLRQRPQTIRRHNTDLKIFADFLASIGIVIPVDEHEVPILATEPAAWAEMSVGIVTTFRTWMLNEGYALGSVNIRLSTVRLYCRLAHQAGVLSLEAWSRIHTVEGYRRREGDGIDAQREATETPTRLSTKKAAPHILDQSQIRELKRAARTNPQNRTPEVGWRDYLIVCLLVDLGMRCGEVVVLKWAHIQGKVLLVDRPKVDKVQKHRLIGDTAKALREYQKVIAQPANPQTALLAAFDHKGNQIGFGISERAIHKRIVQLGKLIGINNLAPHDLRHSWATRVAQTNIPVQALRDAGGWTNLNTPNRYIAQQAIANDGVSLFSDDGALDDDDAA